MNTEEIHRAINGIFVNEHEKQDYVFTKLIEALDTIDAKDRDVEYLKNNLESEQSDNKDLRTHIETLETDLENFRQAAIADPDEIYFLPSEAKKVIEQQEAELEEKDKEIERLKEDVENYKDCAEMADEALNKP